MTKSISIVRYTLVDSIVNNVDVYVGTNLFYSSSILDAILSQLFYCRLLSDCFFSISETWGRVVTNLGRLSCDTFQRCSFPQIASSKDSINIPINYKDIDLHVNFHASLIVRHRLICKRLWNLVYQRNVLSSKAAII